MSQLSVGIVGLPNVGKSTLFNALLKRQAALVANYPFATIEPNIGIVPVPDSRLDQLAQTVQKEEKLAQLPPIKPATVEFVDIAGLVKGAHEGEGLGNQFLHHIRETKIICHVLRAFEDENIIREGAENPVSDLETVRTELQLADLATLDKQPEPKGSADSKVKAAWQHLLAMRAKLGAGESLQGLILELDAGQLDQTAAKIAHQLGLLTAKPELFVVNVSEKTLSSTALENLTTDFATSLRVPAQSVIVMCNQIESELSSLDDADAQAYLSDLGLTQSGLERLIQTAYQTLGLQSFLTAGAKEVRAWTITQGTSAQQAAGVIHTDFAKKMISARVVDWRAFVKHGGWKELKEKGLVRTQGREYVMQEGDVVEFLIGG